MHHNSFRQLSKFQMRWAVRPAASPVLFVVVLMILSGCNSVASVPPKPRPITVINSFASYANPTWTPDGLHLYFDYRPIARISEEPPGSGVYYYFDADSLAGIYRLDLPAGTQHRVFPSGKDRLELSPDGQYLYCEDGGQIWRYTIQADSLDPASAFQVTSSANGAYAPSISASGTRMLYFVSAGSFPGVYLTSASGGAARMVGAARWDYPSWQPNDSSFAFVGYGPGVFGIGIVDTFGVGAVGLRGDGNSPKWSPDGTRIAFLSSGGVLNARENLWVMNRDGSQPRRLTTESVTPAFDWSPDGTQIAYTRFADADTSYVNGTLWLVNVATMQERQLTVNPRP